MKEDKVYKEKFGEPHIDKKELDKENEIFLSKDTYAADQKAILYAKVSRIEKMVYFIIGEVSVMFIIFLMFYLFSGLFK